MPRKKVLPSNATQPSGSENQEETDIFFDIKYICNSTSLIVDALKRGLDVAQLPSGDIVTTEVKTINTHYTWNKAKQKMVKMSQH